VTLYRGTIVKALNEELGKIKLASRRTGLLPPCLPVRATEDDLSPAQYSTSDRLVGCPARRVRRQVRRTQPPHSVLQRRQPRSQPMHSAMLPSKGV
jgi:hypothetical protein